jgi:hypothetical protein
VLHSGYASSWAFKYLLLEPEHRQVAAELFEAPVKERCDERDRSAAICEIDVQTYMLAERSIFLAKSGKSRSNCC